MQALGDSAPRQLAARKLATMLLLKNNKIKVIIDHDRNLQMV